MKMIKMALLGGAALAVSAAGAQADDLTALKAQIESLNSRIASLEAAPSVPSGYSLLTITDTQAYAVPGMTREETSSFAGEATAMTVLPTADAPAGAVIEWSGYVRAAVAYADDDSAAAPDVNLRARGRLNVTARTDTAVGEVGVRMRLEGNGAGIADLAVDMPVAWGWWAMTPELTLGGGYTGTLANIGYGYDSCAVCATIDNAGVYMNPGDTTQMRLTYASGPLSMAIAVEDATGAGAAFGGDPDAFGVAGELAYAGDSFNGEISGGWRHTDGSGTEDAYHVGAGLGFSFDPVSLSLAAAMGQIKDGSDYVVASILAHMDLSDEIFGELAAGMRDSNGSLADAFGVMGGIYYAPVDQLTLGLEGEYVDYSNPDTEELYAGFVAIWSF